MSIISILKRLRYPHKRSAIRYFLHDPHIVFGIPFQPSKLHMASVIERALESNIVDALHNLLPEWFLNRMKRKGTYDKEGDRLLIYLLVRKQKPEIVVETGVAQGLSSAYILCAMHENSRGHLYSIDLPAESVAVSKVNNTRFRLADGQLRGHCEVGCLVPDRVKDRWTLMLGDRRELLPPLLEKLGRIDMFYHDSLHTFEHMKFEYQTAWPYLIDGGLLLSDDVVWNKAFYEACKQHRKKAVLYRTFGILKKNS